MFKGVWLKACGAVLAAVCLGGVSGRLRAQHPGGQQQCTAEAGAQDSPARERVEALRWSEPPEAGRRLRAVEAAGGGARRGRVEEALRR